VRSLGESRLTNDLETEFRVFGSAGFYAMNLTLEGEQDYFIPRSQLKQIKNKFAHGLAQGFERYLKDRQESFAKYYKSHELGPLNSTGSVRVGGGMGYIIKIDRLERLGAVEALQTKRRDTNIIELVFEPKKAFLSSVEPNLFLDQLDDFSRRTGIAWRMALPTVIRGWDEPLVKLWTTAGLKRGLRNFEVGNLGALKLLEDWNQPFGGELSIVGDFTVYGLNSQATAMGRELGLSGMTLSIEDDQANLKNHLARLLSPVTPDAPEGRRVADYYTAIVYKDTPLFIAEACSLTALHKGCPTSKVCGYRTLEVENTEGQRFFVAHETCKSIVYGAEAYSITQWTGLLSRWGVRRARLDFLTRPYTDAELIACCEAAFDGRSLRQTHSANFSTELL
jgi:putative protease